jgi:hypothetical protein
MTPKQVALVQDSMNLIQKSRETVEQLLARRNLQKTYEEKCQYALDLVDMHLHEENPDRIDECIKLYTEDAVWETPARGVSYKGRETIKKMYLRVFDSAEASRFIRLSVLQLWTASSTICGPLSASQATGLRIVHSPSAPG